MKDTCLVKISLRLTSPEPLKEDIPENPAELSYKQLQEILKKGQEFTDFIRELDPIVKRKSKVTKVIEESFKC